MCHTLSIPSTRTQFCIDFFPLFKLYLSVLTDTNFYATIPFAINARGNVVGFLSKSSQEANTMTGTIKTLTERGFGFISRDGVEKDLFFHSKELVGVTYDELKVGDTVTFEVTEGQKGPAATNVSLA